MHRAFKVDCGDVSDELIAEGNKILQKNRNLVKPTLSKYLDKNGVIDAQSVIADWFRQVNSRVFISHSHADQQKALGLAGLLERDFNLEVFIDSAVWGDCRELQQSIDDEYSWINKDEGVYNYQKTLGTAAHVNMMLATALNKMIDRTEVVIFLETDRSVTSKQAAELKTSSSWIYYELEIINSIQIKPPDSHRPGHTKIAKNEGAGSRSLHIQYPLDFRRFSELTRGDYDKWRKAKAASPTEDSLDLLYGILPQDRPIKEVLLG